MRQIWAFGLQKHNLLDLESPLPLRERATLHFHSVYGGPFSYSRQPPSFTSLAWLRKYSTGPSQPGGTGPWMDSFGLLRTGSEVEPR